jgi:hypothetical protein
MNGSESQNLTDEQLLKIIEEGVNGDENIPEEVHASDKGDKDAQGRAAHAFAEMKRKQKTLALELQKYKAKETEDLKIKSEQAAASAAPRAGGNTVSTLMGQLNMQAMQNLGLDVAAASTPEAQEFIRMERMRLYNEQVSSLQRANAIRERAPQIVDEALAQYPMLGADGAEAVKRRLQKYDVLQQTDPEVVRQTVTSYFGELALAGAEAGGSDGTNAGAAQGQMRRDKAGMIAASTVKNGRPGVKPAGRSEEAVKPPTAQEAVEMRKLGTQDVRLYREAQARKHMYAGK